MPHSTTKLIRDANARTQQERNDATRLQWERRNANWVYTLINYVAAFAIIVIIVVIYLEPVSC